MSIVAIRSPISVTAELLFKVPGIVFSVFNSHVNVSLRLS